MFFEQYDHYNVSLYKILDQWIQQRCQLTLPTKVSLLSVLGYVS